MVRSKNRGQSTLEYVLLVTAVLVVLIGMLASSNSPFKTTLNSSLNSAIGAMQTKAALIR